MTQTSLSDPWNYECPVCGARVGEECNYVEGAKHNGWYHSSRYPEKEKENA